MLGAMQTQRQGLITVNMPVGRLFTAVSVLSHLPVSFLLLLLQITIKTVATVA